MELVIGNDTEQFLMAFKRVTATQGFIKHLYSDNALYFTREEVELKETFDKWRAALKSAADQYQFRWFHATPYNAPAAGIWERAVKLVKVPLRKALGKSLLTYIELQTLLKEIEGQVNDRPLINASADTMEVITPSMLCLGRRIKPWVDSFSDTHADTNESVRTRWQYKKDLLKRFRNIWLTDYLFQLRQRQKWFTDKPNLKVGDIVLVEKEFIKKHQWPVAVVQEIITGRDGKIRAARVKQQGEDNVLVKALRSLYPLEAQMDKDPPLLPPVEKDELRLTPTQHKENGGENDLIPPATNRKRKKIKPPPQMPVRQSARLANKAKK